MLMVSCWDEACVRGAVKMWRCSLLTLCLASCVFGEEYREEAFEFDEPVTRLVVDSEGGDVEIVFGDQPTVQADMVYRYQRDEPLVLWTYEEGVLEASVDCAVLDGRCAADIRISAPPVESLVIYAYRGDVNISNASGMLSVDVRYGDVAVEGQPGDVDMYVSSGDLSVQGMQGQTNLLETVEGSMTLAHVGAFEFLRATAAGGDMQAVVLPGAYDLVLGEVAGELSVDLDVVPDTLSAMRLEVSNTTGNVTIATP